MLLLQPYPQKNPSSQKNGTASKEVHGRKLCDKNFPESKNTSTYHRHKAHCTPKIFYQFYKEVNHREYDFIVPYKRHILDIPSTMLKLEGFVSGRIC